MASNVARRGNDDAISEHDIVRLCKTTTGDFGVVPSGEAGTVVHVYPGGTAFEIEFDAPFHVVTVPAGDVERVPA